MYVPIPGNLPLLHCQQQNYSLNSSYDGIGQSYGSGSDLSRSSCRITPRMVFMETFLRPPVGTVRTIASGFCTIIGDQNAGTLHVSIYVNELRNILAANLKLQSGMIILPLFLNAQPTATQTPFSGYLVKHTFPVCELSGSQTMADFVASAMQGKIFLEISTTPYPQGELTGYLAC